MTIAVNLIFIVRKKQMKQAISKASLIWPSVSLHPHQEQHVASFYSSRAIKYRGKMSFLEQCNDFKRDFRVGFSLYWLTSCLNPNEEEFTQTWLILETFIAFKAHLVFYCTRQDGTNFLANNKNAKIKRSQRLLQRLSGYRMRGPGGGLVQQELLRRLTFGL